MSNAGFSKTRKWHVADCQVDAIIEKFANGKLTFYENGDLRKTTSQNPHFIVRKITHFSQMSQAFWRKNALAKIIHDLKINSKTQNPQNEAFTEIRFFANDFAISCVNKSKNAIVFISRLQTSSF